MGMLDEFCGVVGFMRGRERLELERRVDTWMVLLCPQSSPQARTNRTACTAPCVPHPVTGERQLRVGQSPDLIAELVVLMDTGGTLFEAAETGACLALSNLLGRCLHTSALNLRLFLEADGIGVIQRRWRAIQEHEQASLSWLFMGQMVGGEGSAEVR